MAAVRVLVGLLVIAFVAMTLPGGPCCVSVANPSHHCCRTHCLTAAPAAAAIKPPVVFAASLAPMAVRIVAIVTPQRSGIVAPARSFESPAPLPLRI